VRGQARSRTLEWRVRPIAGQRVRFVEAGRDVRNVIKVTSASRGRVTFTPADGAGGKRRILAFVEQNGLPRKTLTAGSYTAPPRPRPGRPRNARVVQRGSRLTVSWRAPVAGFRHAVAVELTDGRSLVLVARAGAGSVAVQGVPRGLGAKATITGLTHVNARGPATNVVLAATAPRPAAGRWVAGSAFGYLANGRFELTRGGNALRRLRLTPAAGVAGRCGGAELQVTGQKKLTRSRVSGRSVWIMGRGAATEPDGANPVPVRATQARKTLNATLELTFDGRRHATGELRFGDCRMLFDARR
jgi:hypothetical protein